MIFLALFALLACLLLIAGLCYWIYNTKKQLNYIERVLDDIISGNPNRRLVVYVNSETAEICYKINRIGTSFQEEKIRMLQMEEATQQLMTNLAHDIRTPLTTLIGYLECIHMGIATGDVETEYFDRALDKAQNMKEYIDKIFEWFRLCAEEDKYKIEPQDFIQLTCVAIKKWITVFEANNIDYEIAFPDELIVAMLDPVGYQIIVDNLIQNVICHSKASKIEICIQKNKSEVTLTIRDNGIGISKEDVAHIFERLYKCDKGRMDSGTGLGLSIAKKLTEIMKGKIDVESVYGQCTSFMVTFQITGSGLLVSEDEEC